MAYFRKRAKGWRAEVEKLGIRDSETFPTKAQAVAWAAKREDEILSGKRGDLPKRYVSEAFTKYSEEVSIGMKGKRWEEIRLLKFGREIDFRSKIISEVTATDIADWRNKRLRSVAPSSVGREWNLLRSVFRIAKDEWRWLNDLPFENVKRPRSPPPRKRRVPPSEVAAMCIALGYDDAEPVTTKKQEIAVGFQVAIETGMRAGELLSLTGATVDPKRRVATLPETKNYDRREVPLSLNAVRLLRKLPAKKGEPLFTVSSTSLDSMFRKARTKAAKKLPAIATLHFHDSRHEACTQLAKKLNVLELARVIGHRDLKSLMIYFNATAEEMAAKLD